MNDRRPVFERKQTKPVTLRNLPREPQKVVAALAHDKTETQILLCDEHGCWRHPNGIDVSIEGERLYVVQYILEPELKRVEQPVSQVGKTLAEAEPGMYLVHACEPHDYDGMTPVLACKPHYGDTVLAGTTSEVQLRVTTSAANLTLGRILAEYEPPRWDTEGGAK